MFKETQTHYNLQREQQEQQKSNQKIYKIKMSVYMICVQYIYLYMTWAQQGMYSYFFFFLNA